MILDRVAVTGADDSIRPRQLVELSNRFPFVEWGVLLSRAQEGAARFPSTDWILELRATPGADELRLSGHLCGSWVRALLQGSNRFHRERPGVYDMFQRIQLNFHGDPHDVDAFMCAQLLKDWGRDEYIFQFDAINNDLFGKMSPAVHCVPLFDLSGGRGIAPDEWPAPIGDYCGYAGGLHPEHLAEQLEHIALAAGPSRIWIDVETHVRSADDKTFDLDKVEEFLAIAKPWVTTT